MLRSCQWSVVNCQSSGVMVARGLRGAPGREGLGVGRPLWRGAKVNHGGHGGHGEHGGREELNFPLWSLWSLCPLCRSYSSRGGGGMPPRRRGGTKRMRGRRNRNRR